MIAIARDAFWEVWRRELGALKTPEQVAVVEHRLSLLEIDREMTPRAWRAYYLATIYHETARFLKFTEVGPRAYFDQYEPGTPKGRALGNTQKGDGYRFRGRGDPHLTGRKNYAWASTVTGIDLVAEPDRALDPELTYTIATRGMLRGAFTGRAFRHFTRAGGAFDPIGARRIINGTDRAALIAGYHRGIERAFAAGEAAAL